MALHSIKIEDFENGEEQQELESGGEGEFEDTDPAQMLEINHDDNDEIEEEEEQTDKNIGILERVLKRPYSDKDPLDFPGSMGKLPNPYPIMPIDLDESFSAADRRSKNQIINSKHADFCPICGDRANGIHYGIYTCEGCKNFFKRSVGVMNMGRPYVCKGNLNCNVTLFEDDGRTRRRTRCQYCRYKACLEAGMMHPPASRYGNQSQQPKEDFNMRAAKVSKESYRSVTNENDLVDTVENGCPYPKEDDFSNLSSKLYEEQIEQLKTERLKGEIEILKSRVRELEGTVEEKSKQIDLQKIQIENLTQECEIHVKRNNNDQHQETNGQVSFPSKNLGFGSITITSLGKRSNLSKKS